MSNIEYPNDLIELETAAWQEIQAGQLTIATAGAVQAAISEFATAAGLDRHTVEMGLKKTVRHTAQTS
ncbi:hypothetical protein [Streptomyces caniscabiei]|uniref:Uncharacterized protein n=1 Tax=Streptomyces caniscabiei TaxID=2746961 RepID=A0ABU4MLR9_9ACTN|nr:hypothetical protein [Streptomyces caniscabiei]MBE4791036.1 hypothetical protein [Streptomyces caniscabiei]MDX3009665.1 hypothetical protein [Streptomyces caniscabiei]MDX3037310.1 hypothetical protein [Streptomyces caniscabiei]